MLQNGAAAVTKSEQGIGRCPFRELDPPEIRWNWKIDFRSRDKFVSSS